MKRIRILLADDHAVVRQGFKMILGAQADMEIVGEAGNGREAVELSEQLRPDIVVMDVAMPELNGIEATRRLLASTPHARVIALSMHKDSVYVREILRAGARGYLLKDSGGGELVSAIRVVALQPLRLVLPSPAVQNPHHLPSGLIQHLPVVHFLGGFVPLAHQLEALRNPQLLASQAAPLPGQTAHTGPVRGRIENRMIE